MAQPRIAILTNIPSHHWFPCGEALHRLLEDRFRMVFLDPVSPERLLLGWEDLGKGLSWVIRPWESERERLRMGECIRSFDAVIFGSIPADLVRGRILSGKLTFRYSERIFKRGFTFGFPWWFNRLRRDYWPLDLPNHHLLASGAYCPGDFRKVGMFRNRIWRWGYFTGVPETRPLPRLGPELRLLWAGRMLDWKRVDLLLESARILRARGHSFRLDLIGDGPEKLRLQGLAGKYRLDGSVIFHPNTTPERVREAMRRAQVYLMPSNGREGWGAVVNEAMASGCCVVSSRGPGSAPWLIEHGKNGYLFEDSDLDGFCVLLESLLDNPERCGWIGLEAWKTMVSIWSPEQAAVRLVALVNGLLGNRPMPFFENGPCSKAVM